MQGMRQRRYDGTALPLLPEVLSAFEVSTSPGSLRRTGMSEKAPNEYHRQKIAADPEYRDVCRDSPRKWRARHPDYWTRYRMEHPEAVDRNRQQQKLRDRKRHLRNLANNTSAQDLKHSAAAVWLVGAGAEFLANNNSASAQG